MELSLRYTTLNVFLCPFEKLIVVTNALLTLILLGKTLLVSLFIQGMLSGPCSAQRLQTEWKYVWYQFMCLSAHGKGSWENLTNSNILYENVVSKRKRPKCLDLLNGTYRLFCF